MTESSIHQPIRRGWLVLRPRSTYVYSDSIVIGILFFFYMECVTVYHIIVSTMIEDGIVNAGWLYVLYVFTQSYCAQYPDRTSDIWRIYDQITNQSNGRNFNQWDGRIQCPSTNQKPGERTNQKTGYKKKRPIDSIHTKLTKKKQIERVQPIKWQDFWPMRLQNPVSINQSDCKKWTNQKRVTSFTSASEQYIQRQNRHWHYGFFDRPMPCNVNITKLSPWITFCWWTRRQWGKSRTNWFKTKSWTIKWESLFAIILPGRGLTVPCWKYYPEEIEKLSMIFAVLCYPWRETIWWRCLPTQTQKTWKCVSRNSRVFIWEETYTWLQNKTESCWLTRIPWVTFTFH